MGAIGDPADRAPLASGHGRRACVARRTTPEERRARSCAATGGRGADIVVEAAGSPRAVEEGLDLVRDGGVYVIAGHYTNVGSSTINAHEQINRKHLDIRGCWGSEARHFLLALTLLERHADEVPGPGSARDVRARRAERALAEAEAMRFSKALVAPRRAVRPGSLAAVSALQAMTAGGCTRMGSGRPCSLISSRK